jgi:flavin-dependent dehydrogenase
VRKNGALFFSANGEARKEIIFADGLIPGLDYTYQVERSKFDHVLLEHARGLGAEVRFQTRATALETVPGGHRVLLEAPDGPSGVTTPWVLDASGRDNLLMSEQKRALDPSVFPKRFAVFSHFTGVNRPTGLAAGHTIAVRLDNGWFWLIPINEEVTSVGLVTTAEAIRRAGGKPDEVFAQAVAASSKLTELMAGTARKQPFRTTNDYSYFRQQLGAERLLLVGDAAGFFDPIFSSGVYMSMWSARRAVEMVLRARREGRVISAAECDAYTRAMKKHASTFQKLITAFYDNDAFAVFMTSGKRFRLENAIVSVVAGHARLTWPMWWRFKLFLLVCWLQRRGIRMVPPLNYEASVLDPARPEPAA